MSRVQNNRPRLPGIQWSTGILGFGRLFHVCALMSVTFSHRPPLLIRSSRGFCLHGASRIAIFIALDKSPRGKRANDFPEAQIQPPCTRQNTEAGWLVFTARSGWMRSCLSPTFRLMNTRVLLAAAAFSADIGGNRRQHPLSWRYDTNRW